MLPRVVFVLGKGGVGRSTVAAALGAELARRGERTCVFGWTVADPIAPWFGAAPAGLMPREVAPRLWVGNYQLDATLELYFVEHLHLPRFYRHVIQSAAVRKLIEASPGLAEVYFVGQVWWLSTLAAEEADLHFDRIVVDAPATGHGVSLFDLPSVLASLRGTGLVGVETDRVTAMMSDPAWTGALAVSLAEELSVEETAELVPRVTSRLHRPPLALFVNRSVGRALDAETSRSFQAMRAALGPDARAGLDTVLADLHSRRVFENALRAALGNATERGIHSLGEQLMNEGEHRPRDVVAGVQRELATWLGGEP